MIASITFAVHEAAPDVAWFLLGCATAAGLLVLLHAYGGES